MPPPGSRPTGGDSPVARDRVRSRLSGAVAGVPDRVHLLSGDTFVDRVPTYRGCGNAW